MERRSKLTKDVKTLVALCFKVICRYLFLISSAYEKSKTFKFPFEISEKLLNFHLTSKDGVNERCLNFIFNHSFIKNFVVSPRNFKNVHNYEFLHNQNFDELKVFYDKNLRITKPDCIFHPQNPKTPWKLNLSFYEADHLRARVANHRNLVFLLKCAQGIFELDLSHDFLTSVMRYQLLQLPQLSLNVVVSTPVLKSLLQYVLLVLRLEINKNDFR